MCLSLVTAKYWLGIGCTLIRSKAATCLSIRAIHTTAIPAIPSSYLIDLYVNTVTIFQSYRTYVICSFGILSFKSNT